MSLRLRYAPSPTGELHLGSLRTIIFNCLVADKQPDSVFLMRIEDTDQARAVEGSAQRQLEAMRWMGIEPDEGVCLDAQGNLTEKGEYGPYTQSQRLHIYVEHADVLLKSGKAYRCFCTSERLEKMREEQQANHLPPRYDRLCRSISAEESAKRAASGETFVIRQAMPEEEIAFTDLVRGDISFNSADLDDQVLMKSDGFPTYHLASVVDDHLMKITHVLRGEEWLPSTPKHLLLYKAFGWDAPAFAHLPVILGPDGKRKLSKRDGDVSVINYKDRGYLPEALFNALAFVGWSPATEEEFFTREQLAERFQLDKVQKSAAVFSFDRLDYVNGWYIRQLPTEKIVEGMVPWLVNEGLLEKTNAGHRFTHELLIEEKVEHYLPIVARAVQERLKHYDETVEVSGFFFKRPEWSPESAELVVPKKGTMQATVKALEESLAMLEDLHDWSAENLELELRALIERGEYKAMEILWPIRAALTGVPGSPGTFEMLVLLGKPESLARLQAVLEVAA
jgi:nondiscriminating glutamyl-tRNA synthetase